MRGRRFQPAGGKGCGTDPDGTFRTTMQSPAAPGERSAVAAPAASAYLAAIGRTPEGWYYGDELGFWSAVPLPR
jgi:hypothetical protein